MCSNDILIALARYITPQDCIINSTLDGCDSTLETQLAPKKKKNITCSYDVMQERKAQFDCNKKKRANKYDNNENKCAYKVDFVFPRCEYHLV